MIMTREEFVKWYGITPEKAKKLMERLLVDVPDMNVGNSSEFPNNSETISRKGCRQEGIGNAGYF